MRFLRCFLICIHQRKVYHIDVIVSQKFTFFNVFTNFSQKNLHFFEIFGKIEANYTEIFI